MPIRSKQTPTKAVALKSFTAQEGRLGRGMQFTAPEARVVELEKAGLARRLRSTKIESAPETQAPKQEAVPFGSSVASPSPDSSEQKEAAPEAPTPKKKKRGK